MPDSHANFAYSTVLTAPSPATSGTSVVVQSGDGAKFPTAPFNCVICPTGTAPTTTNAEIVRVTVKATDTFTITRTQESSSARSVIVGDQIYAAITAKSATDIETMTVGGGLSGSLPNPSMGPVSGGVWQTYTPTWTGATTNPVIGNGTISGRYMKIEKTCHVIIALSFGSTTTGGASTLSLSLPAASISGGIVIFDGFLFLPSSGAFPVFASGSTTTTVVVNTPTSPTVAATTSQWQSANAAGTSGTGFPTISGQLSVQSGGALQLSGTYETA